MAGSPYVPGKLAEKIQNSDIFIADIISIAVSPKGKNLPNPNVIFELGLAVAHLGWDRIVLLFNDELAEFRDLPFDYDRHRISKYKMGDNKGSLASQQKMLDDLVHLAIDTILDQKPLKPRELEGKSETKIKRERDIVNLRWFFRHMSVDMLGRHTDEMPGLLNYYAPVMYDGLSDVLRNPSFRLYDNALEKKLRTLVKNLGRTLMHDQHYRELSNNQVQAFGGRGPYVNHNAEIAAAADIRKSVGLLARNLAQVITTVRDGYIEVDLDDLSQQFSQEYNKMIAQEVS